MKYGRTALELLAIASITAGSGLLLHLCFRGQAAPQTLLLLGVLMALLVWGVQQVVVRQPPANLLRGMARMLGAKGTGRHPHATGVSSPALSPHQDRPMEMTRYFAWLETKLQELVVREGLACGLVRIKRGPLVITLQLRLINPTQKDLQRLLKLGPALAQLLQVETVRIADTAQGVLVEVPSPQPLTPNGALLTRHARGMCVAVGTDVAARPLLVNLEDHGALFWVGPSRRGKTQSMKATLYALIRANVGSVQFLIIASPAKVMKDWAVFAVIAGCLGIACTREDITAAMRWLVAEMHRGRSYSQGLHTILVVDDLPNILKAVPHISQSLADIASMGAGLGVHLLVGTQGAGSKTTSGGTEIENNVTARILYRPSTTRSGSQSAGMGGLTLHQLSSAKGDALALIDGHATRIATAWILDREIALLPQRDERPMPWERDTATDGQRPGQNNPSPPEQTDELLAQLQERDSMIAALQSKIDEQSQQLAALSSQLQAAQASGQRAANVLPLPHQNGRQGAAIAQMPVQNGTTTTSQDPQRLGNLRKLSNRCLPSCCTSSHHHTGAKALPPRSGNSSANKIYNSGSRKSAR